MANLKQYVIVYANEQDSLDVRVSFGEYETYKQACEANGIDEEGNKIPEPCWNLDEHEEGKTTCKYCEDQEEEDSYDDNHSVTIVMEVPAPGERGNSAYYTNG